MNPNNQYYPPSIRNSYGYQDQPNYRYNEQIKTFQPYNPNNVNENKVLNNSIKTM